jgi:hypothetical protein
MSGIVADAAVEIDRLVLSVNDAVDDEYGAALLDRARTVGLDSLGPVPQVADLLLAGVLTPDLAMLRMRYRPTGQVTAYLRGLQELGLVEMGEQGFVVTEPMRGLLTAALEARAAVAAATWAGHDAEVAAATRLATDLANAASEEHVVAAVHRTLPEPADRHLALHQRLVTLRYVRQHDHAAAWAAHGLTPATVGAMTRLWHGEDVDDTESVAHLADRGLATTEPPALTDEGRVVREAVEADTNTRSQETFDALGDDAEAFLAMLRRLPGDRAA